MHGGAHKWCTGVFFCASLLSPLAWQSVPDSINSLVRSASITQYSNDLGHVIYLQPQDVAAPYICALKGTVKVYLSQVLIPSLPLLLCVMDANGVRILHFCPTCNTFLLLHLFPFFIHPNFFLSFFFTVMKHLIYSMSYNIFLFCLHFLLFVCVWPWNLCLSSKFSIAYIHLGGKPVFNPVCLSFYLPVFLLSGSHAWYLCPPHLSLFYLSVSRCWLRLDTYFIWSFIGPATLIIMVRNICAFSWNFLYKQTEEKKKGVLKVRLRCLFNDFNSRLKLLGCAKRESTVPSQ